MSKKIKNIDLKNETEKHNFISEVSLLAKKLLDQYSPLRKNLKVDYVASTAIPRYVSKFLPGYDPEKIDIRVQSDFTNNPSAFNEEFDEILIPTFEVAENFFDIDYDANVVAKNIVDVICEKEQALYDKMLALGCIEGILAIRSDLSTLWLDDKVNPICVNRRCCVAYEEIGVVMTVNHKRMIYFFAQKIKILKKLLEIPENYDKVYYDHKDKFISILKKI